MLAIKSADQVHVNEGGKVTAINKNYLNETMGTISGRTRVIRKVLFNACMQSTGYNASIKLMTNSVLTVTYSQQQKI